MKKAILAIVFIFTIAVLFANKNERKTKSEKSTVMTLNGQISDKQDNEPLVGVKVVLKGTDKVAYTDFDGKYSFKNVKAGNYSLTASYTSYSKSSVDDVNVCLKNNRVDIDLKATN